MEQMILKGRTVAELAYLSDNAFTSGKTKKYQSVT